MNESRIFDELYREHAAAVYRFCLRLVSRREIAEELTGEVFLALHQKLPTLPQDQLPAWLFTVAKRRAADFWRRHYLEERWAATHIEPTEWSAPEHSFADLLQRCTSLTPLHRICLTLRFVHGMSRAEIAQSTRLSELQVKSNLQYALRLLRAYIQPESPATKGGLPDAGTEPHA